MHSGQVFVHCAFLVFVIHVNLGPLDRPMPTLLPSKTYPHKVSPALIYMYIYVMTFYQSALMLAVISNRVEPLT